MGVGSPRAGRLRPGQADLVAAWLGTFELLVEGCRESRLPMPPVEALASAATAIINLADLTGAPWFGQAGVGVPKDWKPTDG